MRIACVLDVDYEDSEFKEPYDALRKAGHQVTIIGLKAGKELKGKKGEKPSYETDEAHLGSMLPELSRLIESFLGNPVFSTTSARDDELRSAAGRDLESIIRLSDTINKIAKRLARTSNEHA